MWGSLQRGGVACVCVTRAFVQVLSRAAWPCVCQPQRRPLAALSQVTRDFGDVSHRPPAAPNPQLSHVTRQLHRLHVTSLSCPVRRHYAYCIYICLTSHLACLLIEVIHTPFSRSHPSGIADPPVCSPEERSIDHAVLLVRVPLCVMCALVCDASDVCDCLAPASRALTHASSASAHLPLETPLNHHALTTRTRAAHSRRKRTRVT